MTFKDIPAGETVFLDANVFVYYFTPHPVFGPPCKDLLDRVERHELHGVTGAHSLAAVAHRLMGQEAASRFGWPQQGMVRRLKSHPAEVQQLGRYRQAIDEIALIGVSILPLTGGLVSLAADVTRQHGLLTDDAVIVATMRAKSLTCLASNDADFDRVPGLTRFTPV
jgi:predicted nucleic acid-binding protein